MTGLGTATPVPVFATAFGIEYPGEMVRAEDFPLELADRLRGDAYFRVVFLETATPLVSSTLLSDGRIAVYVPGERTAALSRAERELRTARSMGGDPFNADLFDPVVRETQEIENWAVGAWTESFKNGRLIAASSLDVDLSEIFRDGYWSTWAERIGQLLLQSTYHELPVHADLLKVPLRPYADAPILFDAFMTGDTSAAFAIDAFGPGLGLSSPDSPRTLDLSANLIAQILTSMASNTRRPEDSGESLAHLLGLTYPLATLFLLLWIHETQHIAHLRPDHGIARRDGRPYLSDRLTSDDIPLIRWPTHRIWQNIESFELADGGRSQLPQER